MRILELIQDGRFCFSGVGLMSLGKHRALESHGGQGPGIPAGLGFLNLNLNLDMQPSSKGLKLGWEEGFQS